MGLDVIMATIALRVISIHLVLAPSSTLASSVSIQILLQTRNGMGSGTPVATLVDRSTAKYLK
jgi:hypothetical protein